MNIYNVRLFVSNEFYYFRANRHVKPMLLLKHNTLNGTLLKLSPKNALH